MLLEGVPFSTGINYESFDENKLDYEIYNRPWGFYKSVLLTPHAQVKIITIFPSSEISLQKHRYREEHWVVIKGSGEVICGKKEYSVGPASYVYIKKECKHKITNTSLKENLLISEVQLGKYFGEDDIVRYSDKYGSV